MSEARVAVVIEDQLDLRELTEVMLVQAGFAVFTAADGPTGIQAVRDHDPLLTTLDVNMPGMDGYEVARQLRGFSQTYIIMITGQADPADVQKAFDAGADDYLVKPFSIRDLRGRAEAVASRQGPTDAIGPVAATSPTVNSL
ncbi:response regulator [Nocardioides sp.]|uniref:response regulator transcription factor n=1 Tax=Nocardioides sp. TaxID=35761 RepID=UPI001A20489D|nr:response regulator [Nocardioides sp.]MBJ7358868.1 response regulator [Nocardioides sp.]